MSAQISLTIQTKMDELARVSSAIEEMGERENWPAPMAFQMNLALEELVINVMNHGHDEGVHEIEITLTSDADGITVDTVDDGRPFNPLTDAPEVDPNAAMEDRRIGGLGVHLVRSMMDEMSYRREQGKNHLTLVKRFGEQG